MRPPEARPVPPVRPARLVDVLSAHRAVVFDLDGVLVDANDLKVDCMRVTLAEFGPELVEDFLLEFRRTFGRSRREHFAAFHRRCLGSGPPGRAIPDLRAFCARYAAAYAALLGERYPQAPLCAGADRLVHALAARGVPMYVATGTLTAEAERVLAGRGLLRAFQAVFGGEREKAQSLASVIAATGAAPDEHVLLGDSRQDMLAAAAAATRFVLVTGYGFFPPAQVLDHPYGRHALLASGLEPDGTVVARDGTGAVGGGTGAVGGGERAGLPADPDTGGSAPGPGTTGDDTEGKE